MPVLTKARRAALAVLRPAPEKKWHNAFLLASWAYLLFAVGKLFYVLNGRMYYLLDSDMCSELVLSHLLREEHSLLSTNWYYSTELRVFNIHWAFTPLFFLTDNWHTVRLWGTALVLLAMLASYFYFCWQARIPHLFAPIAAVLVTPVSDVYFRILLLTISYPPYITLSFLCLGLALQYGRAKTARGRRAALAVLCALSFMAGTNGLRQVLIFYIPLLLAALTVAALCGTRARGETLPHLNAPDRRLLLAAAAAFAATILGRQFNNEVLRRIYHYTSQEGVIFESFSLERLETLACGWLETFGFRFGDFITTKQLFYNAFCFLALAVVVCAFVSLARRPGDYTRAEQVFYLLALYGFLVYNALYFFTDMVYYTRYNIPIAVLLMPVAVDYLYRLPLCRLYRGAVLGVLAALLLWCGQDYYAELWPKNMTQTYEEAVYALRVAGYTEGYATFWNANVMVELSNGAFDIRVWEPGKDVTDPDEMYAWLQRVDHDTTVPEGPVFVFLNKEEAEYATPSRRLTEGDVVYENDHYVALGYESYAAMKADFAD